MHQGNAALFELEIPLPDDRLKAQAGRLIGFTKRYDKIRQDLRLLVDHEGLERWSRKHYHGRVALLDSLVDRYPLAIFHGDVGTGKTATAESVANALASDFGKDAVLLKLSTRVRGQGNVGEMSTLINQAFDIATKEAGKAKSSYLIIDEADSLAASRTSTQSHHEDKVAVNTLIQKVDDSRRLNGRLLVILCTNRYQDLDPAIIRRAAYIEAFLRPDQAERREILDLDCKGLGLSAGILDEIAELCGAGGKYPVGYTYSDIRTRLLPEALSRAYPNRAITREDLIAAVAKVAPSPVIDQAMR
jgi:SpoVK/Ycf46/Vps4 family AAA+-type ATPase